MTVDPIDEARDGWTAAGWGSTALAMVNITSIMRVQQILLAQINAVLRPYEISFARFEVLMVLLMAGGRGGLPLGHDRRPAPGASRRRDERDRSTGSRRAGASGRAPNRWPSHPGRDHAPRPEARTGAIDDLNALVLEPFEPKGDAGEELFALLRDIHAAAGDLDESPLGASRPPGARAQRRSDGRDGDRRSDVIPRMFAAASRVVAGPSGSAARRSTVYGSPHRKGTDSRTTP